MIGDDDVARRGTYARVVTFTPITTERLLIRPFTVRDADALAAWRSHPDVARYQSWAHPFTREDAETLIDEVVELGEPTHDEWWMAAVEERASGEVIGDLAVFLAWQGRAAEVGYNLHPDHWHRGYAVEAVDAFVTHLFDDRGVTRVFATLHPDNRASAQVLERVGLVFEGHTRSSFWDGDAVSDDWIYGVTADDREEWRNRPRHRPEVVRLVEVTEANFERAYFLRTHKTQESFVAPMPKSLSQALVARTDPDREIDPWYRCVEADGEIVGFVMVALPEAGEEPEPYLWRLLVDRLHQRRGIASMALDLVEAEMRERGYASWLTSWVPGRGSPERFYLLRGFQPTGRVDDGEVEGRALLADRPDGDGSGVG